MSSKEKSVADLYDGERDGTASTPAVLSADGGRLGVAKTYKLYIGGAFPRTESGRYSKVLSPDGAVLANVCRASRKDFRDAVRAARQAFAGWMDTSAYLRGQILYRCAEMLEGRSGQFVDELVALGASPAAARREVATAVDRLVYYAGWTDKFGQVFSAVNPVASAHFNFSMPEPTGVVGLLAPPRGALAGLVGNLAPIVAGGNSCVSLSSGSNALSAISFAEVLHASDVPAGVVNLLTGDADELSEHFGSHMDLNAVVSCDDDAERTGRLQEAASGNIKRVVVRAGRDWLDKDMQDPYLIMDTQEIKTTWHPVGA